MNLSALELKDSVPAVTGLDQEGDEVVINDVCSEGYALVFFYPKAETPGCIKQVCSLRDAFSDLSEKGVSVLGVSADEVGAQKEFHENRELPYPLIADAEKIVINAFGVPAATGKAKRQAFLFKDGVLVWKDETASTEEQALDVLAAIDALD
ncbi:peroxiredoxin [Puniceicoccaceae bacterium K14]|nr:peroxiredoxin [Puniceicoccaceae bacterium K14]